MIPKSAAIELFVMQNRLNILKIWANFVSKTTQKHFQQIIQNLGTGHGCWVHIC